MQKADQKVVGIQVMPFIEDPAYYDSSWYIKEQPDGPDGYTTGYFINLRLEDGSRKLSATVPTQEDADFVAGAYAKLHGIEVDVQPWKKQ